jgi:hypothetical protein
MFKPNKQVLAANVNTSQITTQQLDSLQQCTGIVIPATVSTTVTTKQDPVTGLMAIGGSILTVIIMSLLKFFFPQVFGGITIPTP